MAEVRRLAPHDPVPEGGRYMLVLRRFGEDAPDVALTEIIMADGADPPVLRPALDTKGAPVAFETAVKRAAAEADRQGYGLVYAVDRTAGPQERAVLEHHGDRTTGMEKFSDTDPEDGEPGADMRERPLDAGYNLTPRR